MKWGGAALALAIAVGVGVAAAVWGDSSGGAVPAAHAALPAESFLFSQDAGGGSLRGPDDQHLTLTLAPVRNWVTRFTDRPARDAETVDIRDFLDRWNERFSSDPPNAVLSYRVTGDPYPRDMVLELRDPRYSAAEGSMVYSARRIRRTPDRLLGTKHPRKAVVYPIPATFGAASLFIDNASACRYDYADLPDGDEAGVIRCSAPGTAKFFSGTGTGSISWSSDDGSQWQDIAHDMAPAASVQLTKTSGFYVCSVTTVMNGYVDCQGWFAIH